jgi:hypothetical protein
MRACSNIRPDVGAAVAADFTGKLRLQVGQADFIAPLIGSTMMLWALWGQ